MFLFCFFFILNNWIQMRNKSKLLQTLLFCCGSFLLFYSIRGDVSGRLYSPPSTTDGHLYFWTGPDRHFCLKFYSLSKLSLTHIPIQLTIRKNKKHFTHNKTIWSVYIHGHVWDSPWIMLLSFLVVFSWQLNSCSLVSKITWFIREKYIFV